MLEKHAAEALHHGAHRLAHQGDRIDDPPDVLDRDVVDHLDMAGLGVDRDVDRMRAGTIERSRAGYTYREIHVANRSDQRRIDYLFSPQEVARFHVYPPHPDQDIKRVRERLSINDRRSVRVIDPLHRPLYVLFPSLAIRAYSGVDSDVVEVASLKGPAYGSDWPSPCAKR